MVQVEGSSYSHFRQIFAVPGTVVLFFEQISPFAGLQVPFEVAMLAHELEKGEGHGFPYCVGEPVSGV